ncbi:MAG: hypothetical protein AMJ54_02810 [Deltaproteobacteria bacterium SG8_13]|nr:MAG: hypothetical protein AMJ54_02810 [Deltaproteobacteria bacterium SG8_13]
MWWKKILIGLVILVVGLYAGVYAFLHFADLNRFKPYITNAVRDATGRRLTIAGNLEVDFGLLPVLAAENLALDNASWGSREAMIRIERFQVRVALLPLILGRLEIASILLVHPDVLLERNTSGDFNIPSGSGDAAPSPTQAPLIHRIEVENAHLAFYDRQSGRNLELELKYLRAELPDADSPLEIDLEGTFNRTPVAVFGTIGRPLPAFLSGQRLPAAIAVEIADNRFQISGAVENTADFSGLDWKITGAGNSIPDLARLAGLDYLPDPGPFKFQVNLSGSPKHLAISELNLHLGDRRLAKVFLRGRIGDLLRLQDVDLQVMADGDDLKNTKDLFDTTIPWQGEFRAAGRLVRRAGEPIRLEEVELRVGDSDAAGTVAIDLEQQKPRLSATIRSRRFDLRPLFAADAFQRPTAGEKTGKPPPASGSRHDRPPQELLLNRIDAEVALATGIVLLPQVVLNELHTEARLANGRIRVQTRGPRPPDLEELAGIPALPDLGPIRVACDLVGTDKGLALHNVDLEAGSLQQARVTVSGSIAALLEPAGFDLDIRIEGDDAASLGKYLLQPWPLYGRYAVSARMVDPDKAVFSFDSIAGSLEDVDFSGSVKVDASGKATRVIIAAKAPRVTARPFAWPGLEIPETMKQLEDLGPLDVSLVLTDPAENIGIADLQLKVGSAEMLAVSLQGAVSELKSLTGIELELEAAGRDVAWLERLFAKSIPLHGSCALRTVITDPAAGKVRFDDIVLSLAGSRMTGHVELDRSGKPLHIAADLFVPIVDSNELMRAADLQGEPDAGRVAKAIDRQLVLPQWPVPPQLLQNLGADIRIRADRVKVGALDISGLSINGDLQKAELKVRADARAAFYGSGSDEMLDNFQMGGVNLSIKGRAAGSRMTIESFTFRGGSPETVQVMLEGSAVDSISQTGIHFNFDVHGQEAGHLWQLLDADFRAAGPFAISGSLTDPRPKNYRFEDLKVAVGESSIGGQLEIDYTGRRPRISARISSPHLDLRPYQPETPHPGSAQSTPATGSGRHRKLFSDEPWPLEMLETTDLAVSFDAAQLYSSRAALKDLRFEMVVEDGNLVLRPLQFSRGGGKITGELALRTSDGIPTLQAIIEVSDYDVGRELEELDRPRDIQGALNGRIELSGPAKSVAAFMAELNGQVVFTMKEGSINNRIIGTIYGDIGDTLLSLLRPARRSDPFTDLNCLVQSFDVKNGQARHLGLLDTPQTALVTAGTIDLARERLDITLASSPKSGVRVGNLGRIGFSLSAFTRPFKLSGTLARPTLAIDPSQTALTIGKILGGLALGPAGMAAILADVSVGDKNPCLVAMEALHKGEVPQMEKELIEGGKPLDKDTDALIDGGLKGTEKGERTNNVSP